MNYYDRIQNAIDYIEDNLENPIDISLSAQKAYMSLSHFYRIFFALIGYSVKEYIRLRRISLASSELLTNNASLIDIAVKYDFDSADTFSRAFKRITGFLPSEFRKQNKIYSFERVNIMDKYFEVQDALLLEKYPDIKVLKELKPMKVAYFCYYGKDPEDHAFAIMRTWLSKNHLNISKQHLRIFGYNNPSPSSADQEEYGYEVCVTIDDHLTVNDPEIKTKTLSGGLYAVTGAKRSENGDIGTEITKAWHRFNNWLSDSKYLSGNHQWMEEHLGFDEDAHHIGSIDLYMPIKTKP